MLTVPPLSSALSRRRSIVLSLQVTDRAFSPPRLQPNWLFRAWEERRHTSPLRPDRELPPRGLWRKEVSALRVIGADHPLIARRIGSVIALNDLGCAAPVPRRQL